MNIISVLALIGCFSFVALGALAVVKMDVGAILIAVIGTSMSIVLLLVSSNIVNTNIVFCPVCGETYSYGDKYCLNDGSKLKCTTNDN